MPAGGPCQAGAGLLVLFASIFFRPFSVFVCFTGPGFYRPTLIIEESLPLRDISELKDVIFKDGLSGLSRAQRLEKWTHTAVL